MTEKKESSFEVSAALLHAVLPCAAKNNLRHYLNAVCVRPGRDGGAVIAATNGHMMGVVFDRDGQASGESIIDRETVARLPKRGNVSCFLGVVKAGAVTYHDSVIDAKFPDCVRVIPKELSRGIAAEAINLDSLRQAIDLFPRINGSASRKFGNIPSFFSSGPSGAIVIASPGRDALVVVMPAKAGDGEWTLPDYL